jgi:hypothetical protein
MKKRLLLILLCLIILSCEGGGDKNNDGPSENQTVNNDNLVPPRPNIVEFRANNLSAYIAWEPVEKAEFYYVGVRWSEKAEIFMTYKTDIYLEGFTYDITYYCWVTAVNEHGESLMAGYLHIDF